MHPEWIRSIRDQCQSAGVPFFFKQWGNWAPPDPEPDWSNPRVMYLNHDGTEGNFGIGTKEVPKAMISIGKKKAGRTLDGRTWNEYPKNN